jgi:hypothetical protein
VSIAVPLEDLVMMPEVDARRALAGERVAFSVLAPVGPYAGRGTLRVLRVQPLISGGRDESVIELVCGYESYERLGT